MSLHIETFPVYPLGCNCSVIYCDETSDTVLVDPGGSEDSIFKILKANNLKVKEIIHTHAHFDHCLGTKTIADQCPGCRVGMHKEDLFLYQNLEMQCRLFGVPYRGDIRELDYYLEDNLEINFGKGYKIEVMHTPGHSPGSVCFSMEANGKQQVFSGDTLFAGSIGRTDLWGGSYETIIKSIKNRLFSLDDSTIVIPGHGESSIIFNEKSTTLFLINVRLFGLVFYIPTIVGESL